MNMTVSFQQPVPSSQFVFVPMALTIAATDDGPWPLLMGWSEYYPAGVIQLTCDREQLAMSFKTSGGTVSTLPFDAPFVQFGPVHMPV
jgi:hypothetical protein